jgi:hypothetical protein
MWKEVVVASYNPLTPELNPSAKRCLPVFLLRILIFKGLTVRRLYKSFGVQELNPFNAGIKYLRATLLAEIFYF